MIRVTMPTPTSVNEMYARQKVTRSRAYISWCTACDRHVMATQELRGYRHIAGDFEARISLSSDDAGDIDNRLKAIFDRLQHWGVIANDKHCRRLSVDFDGPPGSTISVLVEPLQKS